MSWLQDYVCRMLYQKTKRSLSPNHDEGGVLEEAEGVVDQVLVTCALLLGVEERKNVDGALMDIKQGVNIEAEVDMIDMSWKLWLSNHFYHHPLHLGQWLKLIYFAHKFSSWCYKIFWRKSRKSTFPPLLKQQELAILEQINSVLIQFSLK